MNYRKSPKKELVVVLLREFPELTITKIANLAGCNRTALYADPEARKIIGEREANREAAKASFRRGSITTLRYLSDEKPNIDFLDERQKEPLDILIEQEELEKEKAEFFAW
jgi:hypothetical protein